MASDEKFNHPFQPYDIQIQLMSQVYGLLEGNKKIGIFESPTGTGKTLSLICPTVTWLRNNKAKLLTSKDADSRLSNNEVSVPTQENEEDSDDEPAWVTEAYFESVLKEKLRALKEYEDHLNSKKFTANAANVLSGQDCSQKAVKKSRVVPHVPVVFEDSNFLPDEDSSPVLDNQDSTDDQTKLNAEVRALLGKVSDPQRAEKPEVANLPSPIKIFFASRTHSQLSQFASQLRLPNFPPSFESLEHERIKLVPLGSRKQLCINPKVSKSPSHTINDSCMNAINKKECEPYTRTKDPSNVRSFRDYAFQAIHDIEDMAAIGRATNVCPYYASREFVNDGVEIITLPYQHLINESTRDALGINLKDSIVIIDEAHNIIDTINSINSAEITLNDLMYCKVGIASYTRKFAKRLSPENRVNLKRLSTLIALLIEFIEKNHKNGRAFESLDIFAGSNADTLNIHNLERYMKRTKIAYKIDSYIEHQQQIDASSDQGSKQPVLFKVAGFLKTLTNPSVEGQFFFDINHSMKYMLLEPSFCFKSIVQESKCVLLAGGTMEPISDFKTTLLPFVDEDRISTFSCKHVIPKENLNTFIIGNHFEFTFDKREDSKMLTELHELLLRLATFIPDGMVVFMPSYKFLESLLKFWRSSFKLTDKLGLKRVFHEESGNPDVFAQYADHIRLKDGGAILFAVVSGRLSEGINFTDELARAVIMVGLPFPNVFSGELIIKRKHLEQKVVRNGGTSRDATLVAREFYENMCMKAVNQSIGRAIRHAKDYANIYLIDKRYKSDHIQQKLSNWVQERISSSTELKEILELSEDWYRTRKNAECTKC
ncbi:LAME_0A03576g1_1 [Lachancea meyersii CBS 8951]|uniref:ATP-dependent DNA helicase CHL1 n=1 Tax=Lachancea meyersii CBS 8951 TaxID=1266667 RepID=A0A1G4INY5_9SACH|nr:LAME_0A03576g1_1 [Lachancea meyersii CBS 8951]